ncbi:MAG TPA: GNAT family N-acetyltransferase [Rhizomicrobium sp.]|nr:GNAT family N-acetyltransferase [Rhizomicrobium sp.]
MWRIRDCTADDFKQVAALLRQLWPGKPQDAARLRAVYRLSLAAPHQRYVVAEEEGTIAGFCSLTVKNSLWQEGLLANVDELVVEESRRGQGIGRALLDHVTAIARERGCARVELDSAFVRTEAHRFYEALGFEKRAYLFSKPLV